MTIQYYSRVSPRFDYKRLRAEIDQRPQNSAVAEDFSSMATASVAVEIHKKSAEGWSENFPKQQIFSLSRRQIFVVLGSNSPSFWKISQRIPADPNARSRNGLAKFPFARQRSNFENIGEGHRSKVVKYLVLKWRRVFS